MADAGKETRAPLTIQINIDRVDASNRDDVDDMIDEIVRRIGIRTVIGARLGAGARL